MLLCMSWLSLVTAGTGRAAGERQGALGSQRICAATGAARLVCEKPNKMSYLSQNQTILISAYGYFGHLAVPACLPMHSAEKNK